MSRYRLISASGFGAAIRGRRAAFAVAVLALLLVPLDVALAQIPVPDGFWTVRGRGLGNRCEDWTVRLAVEQGRLTGVLGLFRGNVILQNAVLRPDGSFWADTAATFLFNRYTPPYQVTGQFSGNLVNVALRSRYCPDRRGTATRRPTAY
jgi:hypothetical protein